MKEEKVEEVKEVNEVKVEEVKVEEVKEVKLEVKAELKTDELSPKLVVEDIKSVTVVETPKVLAELKAADESPKPVEPAVQKLDTPPEPPIIVPSAHQVADVPIVVPAVTISKEGGGIAPTIPNVMIDTEPSVHFTPYDTVFDETSQGISHIRYSPKDGDGDMDGDGYDAPPRLSFGSSAAAIVSDDVEDLEPTAAAPAPMPPTESIDVDAPLGSTSDFEELA